MADDAEKLILEAVSITKRFGNVVANDKVDFRLRRGEIHALLGENGAGKTTLCSILYGMLKPDEGCIKVDGREVSFRSPRDAMAAGIGMVHQEFMLVPNMMVAENIALMLDSGNKFLVDLDAVEERINSVARQYGLSVKPRALVSHLSAGEKQRVEILKALLRGADVLILDEPTSVLTRIETRELFNSLRQMASQGKSIIFVTHKIDEAMALADRVTVLRQGKVVATVDTSSVDRQQLARLIVGREVLLNVSRTHTQVGDVLLDVRDVTAMGDLGVPALKNVSLQVRAGEILGIAGVAGNGQRELVEVITGLRRVVSGKIIIAGKDVTNLDPNKIRSLGVAHIPEEQKTGLIFDFTLSDNLAMLPHLAERFKKGILLDGRLVRSKMNDLMRMYEIKASSPDVKAWTLSGGNKQKAILARELWWGPKLIIANNPTKGLDLAATDYVRNVLLSAKKEGKGILLISSELDEVLDMSDRIAVMHDGRVVGVFDHSQIDLDAIASLMLSGKRAA
ncbi:MAG: ABC transporter ATP-binding protein [Aigarchaeota archaeon]|nr:ABC transporter ATP-binding protein [Candidatus Pelearchaeum maunauluense]